MTVDNPDARDGGRRTLEARARDEALLRQLRATEHESRSGTGSRTRLSSLRSQLSAVQDRCWNSGIGTIIVVEGWDAAGKSSAIKALTRELDPRGFLVHPISAPRTHELHAPWLWRFWNRIPSYGQIAIFDESWYRRTLVEEVEGLISKRQSRDAIHDIIRFEQALANDGYVLLKFFLHISREEQRSRLERLEQDLLHSWKVDPEVWQRHRRYRKLLTAAERTLARTSTESVPWTVVDATQARGARMTILSTVIDGLERALAAQSGTLRVRERDAA